MVIIITIRKNLSIIEGKASLVYMLNVIDHGIEKVKKLEEQTLVKTQFEKVKLINLYKGRRSI